MITTRIALSIISILAAFAMMAGATYAFFTDTEVNANNSFEAGSVDIDLITDGETHIPFDVDDMAPGNEAEAFLVVTNEGTEDVKWRAYITNASGSLGSALRVKQIYLKPGNYDYTSLEDDEYIVAGPPSEEDVELLTDPVSFSDLTDPENTPLVWDKDENGTQNAFEPGWAAVYKVVVEMDPDAGNFYQGKSWSGDMTFYATQESNSGW